MEVHHHGHHEGKKTWKSYVWEFSMLFLAVFCGFMAEWQLEHVIENQREKEYMHSIVEDMSEDMAQTSQLITLLKGRKERIDSLLVELSSDGIVKNSNQAYQLWSNSRGFPDFIQNDRTIQQLKSSGALRLIRIKSVSDSIMKYDQTVRQIYVSQGNMNSIVVNQALYNQLFDFIKLSKQADLSIPVPLTEQGKKLLNEAYADRLFWGRNISGLIQRLELFQVEGQRVIGFIKEKYRFK